LHVGSGTLPAPGRNFLHAAKIGFPQPRNGETIQVAAPLPEELYTFLGKLAKAAGDEPGRIDAALKGFL
jgi:hypothetical protein